MRKIALSIAILGTALLPLLFAVPAHAQATRTWVSGVGDDANPCSRTAPCKTFAGAISKTAAGGEINCLDPGGFGALTITKAMTVACDGTGTAGVLVSGTNGIVVSAGATDVVTLRGLDFEGLGTGLVGILFNTGAALHVQNCTIRDFRSGNAAGIRFNPSGTAELDVTDTVITDNGVGTTGGGIVIAPTGAAAANGIISRVTLAHNSNGIIADSTSTSGGINVAVRDAAVTGGAATLIGISANAAGAISILLVDRTTVAAYGTGVSASGAGATVRLNNSVITANGTATSGAGVLSYLNNAINGNGTDTTPATAGGLH